MRRTGSGGVCSRCGTTAQAFSVRPTIDARAKTRIRSDRDIFFLPAFLFSAEQTGLRFQDSQLPGKRQGWHVARWRKNRGGAPRRVIENGARPGRGIKRSDQTTGARGGLLFWMAPHGHYSPHRCGSPFGASGAHIAPLFRARSRQLLPALLYLPTSLWVAGAPGRTRGFESTYRHQKLKRGPAKKLGPFLVFGVPMGITRHILVARPFGASGALRRCSGALPARLVEPFGF